MPRHRSGISPTRTDASRHHQGRGVLNISGEERARDAYANLVRAILIGPSHDFLFKPSTAKGLFDLALDQLAIRDKTTADVLRLYAGIWGRSDLLELEISKEGLEPLSKHIATVEWLLSEPSMGSADNMRKLFLRYRRTVGKKACYVGTLRLQDALLRAYGHEHNYPAETPTERAQRQAWVQTHLPTMISHVQTVGCWHSQNIRKQDLAKIVGGIDNKTSLSQLSACLIANLHPTITEGYLVKRLLPRRRK